LLYNPEYRLIALGGGDEREIEATADGLARKRTDYGPTRVSAPPQLGHFGGRPSAISTV
jgi:hypothetical protein